MRKSTKIELLKDDLEFYKKKMINAHREVRYLDGEKIWDTSIYSDEKIKSLKKEKYRYLERAIAEYEALEDALSSLIKLEWQEVESKSLMEAESNVHARMIKAESIIFAIKEELEMKDSSLSANSLDIIEILVNNYKTDTK